MKCLILIICIALQLPAIAQEMEDSVLVNKTKTVYVMFETDVVGVDLGTKDDYAYKFQDNMIMLKALKENAIPTSLMVKTKTNVFVWIIAYVKDPPRLLIDTRKNLKTELITKSEIVQTAAGHPQPELPLKKPVSTETRIATQKEHYGKVEVPEIIVNRKSIGNRDVEIKDPLMGSKIYWIFSQKQSYRDIGEIKDGIYFSLSNLYVDQYFIFIQMRLFNTTSIAFDIDLVFFERSQGKKLKRREATSTMELPLQFRETVFTVQPSAEEEMVYAIDLFAFQETDRLIIKVNEKGGLRSLELSVPAKEIINAKAL